MKKTTNRFLLASGMVISSLFLLNQVMHKMKTTKDVLSSSHDAYFEWRFGNIRYQKKGSGTPILCIHGLTPGSSIYEMNEIADQLSQNYEVYTIDLLGYGLSDKPNITYTNHLYVDLIIDFIQKIIGRKCNILTSNDSSSIAIMVCNQEPTLVSKMIFLNPADLFSLNEIPSAKTKLLKKIITCPVIGTFIYHLYLSESIIMQTFVEEYFYNPNKIKEKDIQAYLQANHCMKEHGKYAYTSFACKYMNTNIIHALKTIDNSILILESSELEESLTNGDNYIYYNPSIEIEILSRCKKLMTLECPTKIMHYIKTFL